MELVLHFSEQQGAVIDQDMLQGTSKSREEKECRVVKHSEWKIELWLYYGRNSICHTLISNIKSFTSGFYKYNPEVKLL